MLNHKNSKFQPKIILSWMPTQDYHGFVINSQLEDVSSRSQKKRASDSSVWVYKKCCKIPTSAVSYFFSNFN